jgi:hypothetical protein
MFYVSLALPPFYTAASGFSPSISTNGMIPKATRKKTCHHCCWKMKKIQYPSQPCPSQIVPSQLVPNQTVPHTPHYTSNLQLEDHVSKTP